MIRSIDFADLQAGIFGCLREGESGERAAWLNSSGELAGELELSGEGPSLSVDAGRELTLALTPVLGPVELPGGGSEWICRAEGLAAGAPLAGQARVAVERQASEAGAPLRSLSAWIDPALAFVGRAAGPDPEAGVLRVWVLRGEAAPSPVDDPRLSTAYGADGAHARATLELWEAEESDFPLRLAGERVAGARLLVGGMRHDCAFLRWEHEGRSGAGCYELASPIT